MSKAMECKFFNTIGGCRFGSSCRFLHSRPAAGIAEVSQLPHATTAAPAPALREARSNSGIRACAKASTRVGRNVETIEELWAYKDEESTRLDIQAVTRMQGYADALQKNLDRSVQHAVAAPSKIEPSIDPALLCRFFVAGNCRFGSKCRYIHALPAGGGVNSMSEPISQAVLPLAPVECGICLEAAAGSVYGLLSHCSCKFCLKCIRDWRERGIQVSHDSEQVRLCPLCRTQSYFVVPSREYVTGEAKTRLLEAYKTSLANKPCRYYANNKDCPFGTSCFYMHEADGSKGVKVTRRNAGHRTIDLLDRLRLILVEESLNDRIGITNYDNDASLLYLDEDSPLYDGLDPYYLDDFYASRNYQGGSLFGDDDEDND